MESRKLKFIDKYIGSLVISSLRTGKNKKSDNPISVGKKLVNILFIKTVGIGDLMLLLPAIKGLKNNLPNSKITLLTTPRTKEVVEGQPFIDEIIYWDPKGAFQGFTSLLKIFKKIRGSFDVTIDAEHYYNFSSILSYFSKAPARVGFRIEGQSRQKVLTHPVVYQIEKHEIENFLSLLRPFALDAIEKKLVPIATSRSNEDYAQKIVSQIPAGKLIVVIHPGTSSSAAARRWPIENFADLTKRLINKLKTFVIITGTKDEEELIRAMIKQVNSESSVFNLAGKTTLKQFAEIIKNCHLFISADTGPMHVAASVGTTTLGLFGPNTPLKWGPYGGTNRFIYKPTDCSPCIKQYLGQITQCQDNKCMQIITIEEVFTKLIELLSKQSSKPIIKKNPVISI